jgi:type I restriction enzyme S subunit
MSNWAEYELIDVVNLKSGVTVKKELEQDFGDVAYIKVSGMTLVGNEVKITTANTYLNHGDININNILPIGTTIFPKRGGAIATNKKRITDIHLCIDLNTMGVIPKLDLVLPLYIYYYFKTFDLLAISNGTTIPQINNYSFNGLKILVPSLPEQKRIIAILDQAFADIDKARATAERNLKNARELFDSYLEKVSHNKNALGKYVTIKTGKLDSNAAIEGGKYPFFTCSRDVFEIDSFSFDCEAILLAGNNAVGNFNVKHYSGKFDAYQRTYVITIDVENDLDYRFLYYQMLKSLKELKNSSVGAGTKFLKIGMIKDLKISVPSIDEQKDLVLKIDKLNDSIEKLANIYEGKLSSLDELKKSILQKAFSGELTKSKGTAA